MPDDVHPQIQAVIDAAKALGMRPIADMSPAEARAQAEDATAAQIAIAPSTQVASVENTSTGPGYRHVPVRIYRPNGQENLPVIVYFHGGGHVICSLDTHDPVARYLCKTSGCAVVSVDYAMGPEQPFPAAPEDCFAATRWMAKNAERLGFDPSKLAVAGDSAGGNLAAVVALMALDAPDLKIAAQVLVYPVIDYRGGTKSYEKYGKGYGVLDTDAMDWFRHHYFATVQDMDDWRAAPHLAASHHGLPPALVLCAECDVLRDEGWAYSQSLKDAGVPTEYVEYPGMIHAFFSYITSVDDARTAHQRVAEFLHKTWG